jgi:RNA-directed DNA polymerase
MEIAKVQKSLATKAQYQPTHRFNDLYRYVRDVNWLESARNAILHNHGANTPGVDGIKGKELTRADWCALINDTVEALRAGTYLPQPVKRVYIPKANGKQRPLGIATIQDRMVQEVLRMVLEPIYESHFLPCSNGFRPARSTMTAIHTVQLRCNEIGKFFWIVEGDIQSCFDAIPHDQLLRVLRKVIADERLLSLIWAFLKAGYVEDNQLYKPKTGTPQGGICSPLLANAYLHELDKYWWHTYGSLTEHQRECRRKAGQGNVYLVRYADDFLALTNGPKSQALQLKAELGRVLADLGLTLAADKTLVTHVNDGFTFLGFHIQRKTKPSQPTRKALYVTATQRNIQRYKDSIQHLLKQHDVDVVNKIRALNRVIEGWANYYRYVQTTRIRDTLENWTFWAVWRWLKRKHGGELGDKAIHARYMAQRNPAERATLGYGGVKLTRMSDIPFQRYYLPKGGIGNPYLSPSVNELRIGGDEPIVETTWNGISAQNSYAIARQDLLLRYGPICQGCGQTFPADELSAHHKQAQRADGKHGQANLELLCQRCHIQTPSYGKSRKM